jgi:hypothetical protein
MFYGSVSPSQVPDRIEGEKMVSTTYVTKEEEKRGSVTLTSLLQVKCSLLNVEVKILQKGL